MSGLALSNPKVQRLRRLLGRRSARLEEGALVVEGLASLTEAVRGGWAVESVFVAPGTPAPHVDAPVYDLAAGVLERVATTTTPQPVMAVVHWRGAVLADVAARKPTFVVVAAGVADPGNAGTILRSAEAAGADAVVFTEGSVDVSNPKSVRASAGALFHVPVVTDVSLDALRADLGLPLLGTAAIGGTAYDRADLRAPVAIVLGNEAHGIPVDLPLDGILTIPHAGRAESLNVAMAASVLCFEAARQRRS